MVSANFPRKGTHVRRKADGTIGEVYASDPFKGVLTVRWRTATGFLTQVCTSEHFARDWELTPTIFNLPGVPLAPPGALASDNKPSSAGGLFKAVALIMLGLVLWFFSTLLRPSKHAASPVTAAQPAWDGVKGHPDCSPDGHPDPDHPGVIISDEYTDACRTVSNADNSAAFDLKDAKYLDDHYGVGAAIGCADGADDYLRSVAKWDFKWDEIGALEAKFDKYRAYVKSPGVLTSVSKKAKLQNGFGAYKHITLTCDYDTQAQKVVSYEIER